MAAAMVFAVAIAVTISVGIAVAVVVFVLTVFYYCKGNNNEKLANFTSLTCAAV